MGIIPKIYNEFKTSSLVQSAMDSVYHAGVHGADMAAKKLAAANGQGIIGTIDTHLGGTMSPSISNIAKARQAMINAKHGNLSPQAEQMLMDAYDAGEDIPYGLEERIMMRYTGPINISDNPSWNRNRILKDAGIAAGVGVAGGIGAGLIARHSGDD